jgi:hypothetical protein
VSRAWDFVLRIVLHKLITPRVVPFNTPPQTDPPNLTIGLPDDDRDDSRQFVKVLNAATDVTNAVVVDAKRACKREHEQLAADLGLKRGKIGFSRE